MTNNNWDAYGTDVGVEFGKSSAAEKISIQDTLGKYLEVNEQNKYILFDHGSGEIADYIAIQESEAQLIVRLFHVKKKTATGYNSSMDDIYEVAGQAVKSITWLTTKGRFADKVYSRRSKGHCIPIRGDFRECIEPNRRPVGDSLPSLSTTIKTASCQGGLFCLLSSCF